METPVMSPGNRSLVNCTRAKQRSSERSRAAVAAAPDGLVSGAEVRIADARKNFIARGFWAAHSPIALRVLSRADSDLDQELLASRLRRAWERRRAMFPAADAFRLAHGEADLIPGYFVDWYNGHG